MQVTGDAIFVGIYVASVGVLAATIAWQHGWNRGVDHAQRQGPERRTFHVTVRHEEPLLGVRYTTWTVSRDTPIDARAWRHMVDEIQKRAQAQHRPIVVSAVELDTE